MAKMFKLLENELDMLYACLCGAYKTAKSVETIADYILENDDVSKYTTEEFELVKIFSQEIFNMGINIETKGEQIQEMKSKIADLY